MTTYDYGSDGAVRLEGVSLVVEDPAGVRLVGGLALAIDALGVTVDGGQGSSARTVTWSEVLSLSTGRSWPLDAGRSGVQLDLVTTSRRISFVIPVDRLAPGALDSVLAMARTRSQPPAPPQPGPWGQPQPSPFQPPAPPQPGPWGQPPAPPQPGPWGAYETTFVGGSAASRRRSGGRTRRVVLVAAVVVVLAGVGAAVVAVTRGKPGTSTPHVTNASGPPHQELVAVAQGVNLAITDMPTGWMVASSSGGQGASSSPSSAQVHTLLGNFASCLGTSEALVSHAFAGVPYAGEVDEGSPTFTDSTQGTTQVSSTSSIVPTSGDASQAVALLFKPQFGSCMGTYSAAAVQLGITASSGASSGVTATVAGKVETTPLSSVAAVRGVSFVVPVMVASATKSVVEYLSGSLLASGRVEGAVSAVSTGSPFPPLLFASLTHTVAQRVASASKELSTSLTPA